MTPLIFQCYSERREKIARLIFLIALPTIRMAAQRAILGGLNTKNFVNLYNKFLEIKDFNEIFSVKEVSWMANNVTANDKMMGAVAYLGWWVTGLIFLLTEKKNSYIRFHAMQSVVLFGSITLLFVVFGIVPIIGWIIGIIISPVIWFVAFVLWLVLMWKAYNGEKYKLPYFGDLAEKQLAKLQK